MDLLKYFLQLGQQHQAVALKCVKDPASIQLELKERRVQVNSMPDLSGLSELISRLKAGSKRKSEQRWGGDFQVKPLGQVYFLLRGEEEITLFFPPGGLSNFEKVWEEGGSGGRGKVLLSYLENTLSGWQATQSISEIAEKSRLKMLRAIIFRENSKNYKEILGILHEIPSKLRFDFTAILLGKQGTARAFALGVDLIVQNESNVIEELKQYESFKANFLANELIRD